MVQLAGQSAPNSSTPIKRPLTPEREHDHLDVYHSTPRTNKAFPEHHPLLSILKGIKPESHNFYVSSLQDEHTDGSAGSSPLPEAVAASGDTTFVSARGSSFFIGKDGGDSSGISFCKSQSKDDLAGSYRYTPTGTPPEVRGPPAGRTTPTGGSSKAFKKMKLIVVVCQTQNSKNSKRGRDCLLEESPNKKINSVLLLDFNSTSNRVRCELFTPAPLLLPSDIFNS